MYARVARRRAPPSLHSSRHGGGSKPGLALLPVFFLELWGNQGWKSILYQVNTFWIHVSDIQCLFLSRIFTSSCCIRFYPFHFSPTVKKQRVQPGYIPLLEKQLLRDTEKLQVMFLSMSDRYGLQKN